jgi:hypothetical protein
MLNIYAQEGDDRRRPPGTAQGGVNNEKREESMTLTEKIKAIEELAQIIRRDPLHTIHAIEYEGHEHGICTHQMRLFKTWTPDVRLLIPENATRKEVLAKLEKILEYISTAEKPPWDGWVSRPEVSYDGEMLRAVADRIDEPDESVF